MPVFTGKAGEYFGIWLVNLLLSLLTLGIYSAWAKVRTERYFYGHTHLAGATLEYTASPVAILKGRLLAYAVALVLGVSGQFFPLLYWLLLIPLFFMMPVIVVFSLRFRARNTSWRGLSLAFDKGIGEAYLPFFLWRLLGSMSMSVLGPLVQHRQQEYVVNGHRYGRSRFRFSGTLDTYYTQFLHALGIGAVVMLLLLVCAAPVVAVYSLGKGGASAWVLALLVLVGAWYLVLFVLMLFLRVRYSNLLWRHARVGQVRFESTLRARDMLWLYTSNALVITCSLGLAMPWAKIRLARYRAKHFALVTAMDLDTFQAGHGIQAGAAGAELMDAIDSGIDFGM